jgi:hypothetical protein
MSAAGLLFMYSSNWWAVSLFFEELRITQACSIGWYFCSPSDEGTQKEVALSPTVQKLSYCARSLESLYIWDAASEREGVSVLSS